MSDPRPGLDDDRLRRLARELDAVVRREVPGYDGDQEDLGLTLTDLFAFLADILADYQSRLADEAYLETGARLAVAVDASPWREVSEFEGSGPCDAVYVVDRGADGSATVRFGDGRHGRRPPDGAHVSATYRVGAGRPRATVTVRGPGQPPLALEVHTGAARISFAPPRRSWRDCLARLWSGRP